MELTQKSKSFLVTSVDGKSSVTTRLQHALFIPENAHHARITLHRMTMSNAFPNASNDQLQVTITHVNTGETETLTITIPEDIYTEDTLLAKIAELLNAATTLAYPYTDIQMRSHVLSRKLEFAWSGAQPALVEFTATSSLLAATLGLELNVPFTFTEVYTRAPNTAKFSPVTAVQVATSLAGIGLQENGQGTGVVAVVALPQNTIGREFTYEPSNLVHVTMTEQYINTFKVFLRDQDGNDLNCEFPWQVLLTLTWETAVLH